MSDPITKAQGDKIIKLLENILEELEEIKDNTSVLPMIQNDLEKVQGDVNEILAKAQEK